VTIGAAPQPICFLGLGPHHVGDGLVGGARLAKMVSSLVVGLSGLALLGPNFRSLPDESLSGPGSRNALVNVSEALRIFVVAGHAIPLAAQFKEIAGIIQRHKEIV